MRELVEYEGRDVFPLIDYDSVVAVIVVALLQEAAWQAPSAASYFGHLEK